MKFNSAGLVEQIVWDMRLADLPRGENRTLIDRLGNGRPPWTKKEQESARVKTNVNFLEFPELCADARRSYHNAFLKPANFFNVSLDSGPPVKRKDWSRIITQEMNKVMKQSPDYFEFLRSQIAMTVLHGIGPSVWGNQYDWCPIATGIEDVMIPSNTYLTMQNLSYFAIYKEWTAAELYRKVHGPRVDPGWNVDMADAAIRWADEQTRAQVGYSDLYAPEKVEDRLKQDLGFYASDAIPTINCWDFYFWSDEGDKQGWRRRMIIDTPCSYEVSGRRKPKPMLRGTKNQIGQEHGEWLYNPGDNRVYADKFRSLVHFQFGDASAVAPFKYHAVRSLGWLLYAVCHLQNRLRCKLNDAIFESLLQYFRVANPDDKERLLKIDLHHLGVIPEGTTFVRQEERWKVDQALASLGLNQNQQRMQKAAAQFREGQDEMSARKEKTATEIMAEVNAANALVGALLLQAYQYQEFQGLEIARRFCIKNSKNMDVRAFRAACLRRGVPEEQLDSTRWNTSVERVLGSGNKTMQIAMADKLMAVRGNLDPDAQREVDHQYVLANTDDPDLTDRLVPLEKPELSDTKHDAAVAMAALFSGVPVPPKKGENQIEVVETWLNGIGARLKLLTSTGMPSLKDLAGIENAAVNTEVRIKLLAQDRSNAPRAKEYMKVLQTIMKQLKKMAEEAKKVSAMPGDNGQGVQMEQAKEQAKLKGKMMMDQVKARNAAVAHAQKTKQRDVQFRMKLDQDKARHQLELGKKAQETQADLQAKLLTTAADIETSKLRALNEGKEESSGAE